MNINLRHRCLNLLACIISIYSAKFFLALLLFFFIYLVYLKLINYIKRRRNGKVVAYGLTYSMGRYVVVKSLKRVNKGINQAHLFILYKS